MQRDREAPPHAASGSSFDAAVAEAVSLLQPTGYGVKAAVTLQVPLHGLRKATRPNIAARALLALDSGGLWLAEVIGQRWTEPSLRQLVEAVTPPADPRTDRRTPTQRAQDLLGLSSVVVRRPALDDLVSHTWPTRAIAVSMILTGMDPASPAPVEADVIAVKHRLDAALRDALGALKLVLDHEPFDIALRHPRMAAEVYGYLSDSVHGAYRLQFAKTLPLLLPCVAAGDGAEPYAGLRATIDRGDELLRAATAAFGVSPATMRCLVGQDPHFVGKRWLANPAGLLQLLDSIVPEARPGRGDCRWEHLNSLVHACEEASGLQLDESFFVRAWVRAQMHRRLSGGRPADAPDQPSHEVLAIERFRQALMAVLQSELGSAAERSHADAAEVARIVDRALRGYELRQLGRLALKWQDRLDGERASDKDLLEFVRARGDRYWPLLQRPHASSDGTRVVAPLLTAEQLVEHGRALDICLAKDNVHDYISACRQGRLFILALREPGSGRPVSTADIRLVRQEGAVALEPVVAQHTRAGNATPSAACKAALDEALDVARSSEGQAHLKLGMTVLRTFRRPGAAAVRQVEALASLRAFRTVLGGSAVDSALRSARALSPAASTARVTALAAMQGASRSGRCRAETAEEGTGARAGGPGRLPPAPTREPRAVSRGAAMP